MGLIKAALNSVTSTMKDQWKEFFYCESLANDVLVVKGTKKSTGLFKSNNGQDNVISNGSGIVVADGQCMIIVDNGKIVEVCAEPGEFTFDTSSESSLFTGSLSETVKKTVATMWERFQYAGETNKEMRVYYVNTREILDNKFGTPTPIPFKVVDKKVNYDVDVALRISGTYSFRIFDPVLFYTNVAGNVSSVYTKDALEATMKADFLSALNPAVGMLSTLGLRPSDLPMHTYELEGNLNKVLDEKWGQLRGIEVVNVQLTNVTLPEEDAEELKKAQRMGMFKDADMYKAGMAQAQMESMVAAANNAAGAVTGFAGLNMTSGAHVDVTGMYTTTQTTTAAPANSWTCGCGTVNTGNYCSNCGTAKPVSNSWTCGCGTVNTGNYCSNCGTKKPN